MPSTYRLTRTVEFHETDMAGIMHFANFFRWMEVCETAFYRSLDLPIISFVPGEIVGWPRVDVRCTYRSPLRFNDVVEVVLLVKKISTRSVTFVFKFEKDQVLVAQGEVTAVCVGMGEKGAMVSQAIPVAIRAKIEEAPESACL